jgi:V/A-type H+/Na+-transporting ATPase subunit D
MARKIKLTRPELKRQRDMLGRFERYLPMLKLKQQQLQLMVRNVKQEMREAQAQTEAARKAFESYRAVFSDRAGVDVESLAEPQQVKTHSENIAGVVVPVFESVEFAKPSYSLFATPAWVDRALLDLRELNRRQAKYEVLREEHDLLDAELTKITQRVNLFEKVKIPECRESIRTIRIHLGDEQTAAVGRAKIAKSKLTAGPKTPYGGAEIPDTAEATA